MDTQNMVRVGLVPRGSGASWYRNRITDHEAALRVAHRRAKNLGGRYAVALTDTNAFGRAWGIFERVEVAEPCS